VFDWMRSHRVQLCECEQRWFCFDKHKAGGERNLAH
jgi:hypothetical protein